MTDNKDLYPCETVFTLADLMTASEKLKKFPPRLTKITFNKEGFKHLKQDALHYKASTDLLDHFNGIPCFLDPDQEELYKIHY